MSSANLEAKVVQPISASKQRKSLGEISKREKEQTKRLTKTTVVNPKQIDWPDVNDEDSLAELKEILEQSITVLKFPIRKTPLKQIRTVDKDQRQKFRQEWRNQQAIELGFDMQNYIQMRSSLAIGVNCVSRTLELDQLAGVIIEKNVNPTIITKMLVPIALGRNVPIIAVEGLNEIFRKTANVKCIAVGFKESCARLTHQFHRLLEMVKSLGQKYLEEPDLSELRAADNTATCNQAFAGTPVTEEEADIKIESTSSTPKIKKELKRKRKQSIFQTPKVRKLEIECTVKKKPAKSKSKK